MKKFIYLIILLLLTLNIFGQKNFSLSIYYQPSYSYRVMSLDNELLKPYYKNDKPILGQQFGLGIAYNLGIKFQVNSGLSYIERGFKSESSISEDGVHFAQNDLNKVTRIDRYYYLSAPIVFSYKILGRDNIAISVVFGITGDIFIKSVAKINAEYVDRTVDSTIYFYGDKYTRPLNISPLVGLEFCHHLSEKIGIILQPNFTINTLSIYKDTDINPRLWDLGIKLGVKYQL